MTKAVSCRAGVLLLTALLAVACSGSRTTATPTTTPTASATPRPSAAATAQATASVTPTRAAATGPVGTAVPAGFVPRSATFISDRTGWVLGRARCLRGPGQCDAVVRTRNGGRTWRAVPAPATGPDQVAQVRFADERNGFVTGRVLWVTHDGGSTWTGVSGQADVTALEAAAGRVWIVRGGVLRSAPVAGGPFVVERTPRPVGAVVVHGETVYAAAVPGRAAPALYVGTHASGLTPLSLPCASDDLSVDVAARSRDALLLVCLGDAGAGSQGRTAWLTADAGAHWRAAAEPAQTAGVGVSLVSGAGFLLDRFGVEVTRDDGRSWQQALRSEGALAGGGFVSSALGFVLGGGADGGVLRLTRDQGRTWSPVAF